MPTGQHQEKVARVSDEVALVIHAALLAAWMSFLCWSSLTSHLPSLPRVLAWDKLQHFFAYAILMFFSGNFFTSLLKNRRRGWITGFFFSVGFGLLMEIGQQTLAASRYADGRDIAANTLGAGLVLAIVLLKKPKKS